MDQQKFFNHKMWRSFWIYGLLVAGSLIFAWPLVWMAGTSFKTGREIVESSTTFWPARPIPRSASPYFNAGEFSGIPNSRRIYLAVIEKRLDELGFGLATRESRSEVRNIAAEGILQRLDYVLPPGAWKLPKEQVEEIIRSKTTSAMADEAIKRARKELCLGSLTIRSLDMNEQVLIPSESVSAGWKIEPERASEAFIEQAAKDEKKCGVLHYDFGLGKNFRLTQTFNANFPVDRLYRIQLAVFPDDSWNLLDIYVEKMGVLYKSSHSATMGGGGNWTTLTWQEKDQENGNAQVKIWTGLEEVGRGSTYLSDPGKIKITLDFKRVGASAAWWKKITRNYELALKYIPFWRYLANSLFLVLTTVVATLFSCSLVAYSFARVKWPGRNLCFVLMLATLMIPSQVTMIPQFLIIRSLGWYDTLLPLWVPHFFGNAFYIFMMVQFLKGVPKDLEEAARIDGCGFFRIYWHIMLPLVKPTMVSVAVLTIVSTWNDFMGPLIYINEQQLYPLSFGLYAFTVQAGADVGMNTSMMMAAALLMTLPLIFLFLFAQRYFIQGVALTGMK